MIYRKFSYCRKFGKFVSFSLWLKQYRTTFSCLQFVSYFYQKEPPSLIVFLQLASFQVLYTIENLFFETHAEHKICIVEYWFPVSVSDICASPSIRHFFVLLGKALLLSSVLLAV